MRPAPPRPGNRCSPRSMRAPPPRCARNSMPPLKDETGLAAVTAAVAAPRATPAITVKLDPGFCLARAPARGCAGVRDRRAERRADAGRGREAPISGTPFTATLDDGDSRCRRASSRSCEVELVARLSPAATRCRDGDIESAPVRVALTSRRAGGARDRPLICHSERRERTCMSDPETGPSPLPG